MNTIALQHRVTTYLRHFGFLYPGIDSWSEGLFRPDPDRPRTLVLLNHHGSLCGLAVTKNASSAKLCHISVRADARKLGFGSLLASSAIEAMWHAGAKSVRVTTSEDVFYDYGNFFRGLGFREMDWYVGRYRPHTAEIVWSSTMRQDTAHAQSFLWPFIGIGRSARSTILPLSSGFSLEMISLKTNSLNLDQTHSIHHSTYPQRL